MVTLQMRQLAPVGVKYCAIFIDFENFFYTLENEYKLSQENASDSAIEIINNQLDELQEKIGPAIIKYAYADWAEFSDSKRELQRMGIRVFDVLSSIHKNSADIELSLAAQQIILTRDDITVIVIFAGDRDYMPIVQRISEAGRDPHLVGFEKSLSGDLKKQVGEGNYTLVEPPTVQVANQRVETEKESDDPLEKVEKIKGFNLSEEQVKTLVIAIQSYDHYKREYGSVKLSGFLVLGLKEALPYLDHNSRKAIFNSLVELGLIILEKRTSDYLEMLTDRPQEFIVFTIDEDRREIKQIREVFNLHFNQG